jgi:UDP-GlcNAc3NAcA epimerase
MKLLTIVGARPQFIKASVVSRAICSLNESGAGGHITEEILHTGQHYDNNMSQVFFEELGIPEPAINLSVGSGTHGDTTGRMLVGIEREIVRRKPDYVLVYGDTNSTLAGALAAVKLHVPVAHVEAGLRSFNRKMPEEINRVLTDQVSDLLFCPTRTALQNLKAEGITRGTKHIGDVMYDVALMFGEIAAQRSTILTDLGVRRKSYYLATVHRAENTDNHDRLCNILAAFNCIGTSATPVIFPVHPRTHAILTSLRTSMSSSGDVRFIKPVSFLDMLQLEKHAQAIFTDSGGVQKEAYFHGVPCVTLRDETEWTETVAAGWNQVVGVDTENIVAAVGRAARGETIEDYGTGSAAVSVAETLVSHDRPC